LKLSQEWGKRKKEDEGGSELNYGILTWINITIYPRTTLIKDKKEEQGKNKSNLYNYM
jgi:hypothetical protein